MNIFLLVLINKVFARILVTYGFRCRITIVKLLVFGVHIILDTNTKILMHPSPFNMSNIADAYANTYATTLMHVKNSMHYFCLWYLLSGTLEQRKWKKKNIKFNSWSLFYNFI